MKRRLSTWSLLILLATAAPNHESVAQNLLTNNPGFEAGTAYYTPGWGWPQGTPDAVQGWTITLDPGGDGYAGAAASQSIPNLEGTNFAYVYSGWGSQTGLLETAVACRAPVDAGNEYTLWFLARSDSTWSEPSASVSLVWYHNRENAVTVGEPAVLEITLPSKLAGDDPMMVFGVTGLAPAGAHYAGVSVARPPNTYDPVMLDDFVLLAEPRQVSLLLGRAGDHVKISWPRSLKYELEETDRLGSGGGWHKVSEPVHASGGTCLVDYSAQGAERFFRLRTRP